MQSTLGALIIVYIFFKFTSKFTRVYALKKVLLEKRCNFTHISNITSENAATEILLMRFTII